MFIAHLSAHVIVLFLCFSHERTVTKSPCRVVLDPSDVFVSNVDLHPTLTQTDNIRCFHLLGPSIMMTGEEAATTFQEIHHRLTRVEKNNQRSGCQKCNVDEDDPHCQFHWSFKFFT